MTEDQFEKLLDILAIQEHRLQVFQEALERNGTLNGKDLQKLRDLEAVGAQRQALKETFRRVAP